MDEQPDNNQTTPQQTNPSTTEPVQNPVMQEQRELAEQQASTSTGIRTKTIMMIVVALLVIVAISGLSYYLVTNSDDSESTDNTAISSQDEPADGVESTSWKAPESLFINYDEQGNDLLKLSDSGTLELDEGNESYGIYTFTNGLEGTFMMRRLDSTRGIVVDTSTAELSPEKSAEIIKTVQPALANKDIQVVTSEVVSIANNQDHEITQVGLRFNYADESGATIYQEWFVDIDYTAGITLVINMASVDEANENFNAMNYFYKNINYLY